MRISLKNFFAVSTPITLRRYWLFLLALLPLLGVEIWFYTSVFIIKDILWQGIQLVSLASYLVGLSLMARRVKTLGYEVKSVGKYILASWVLIYFTMVNSILRFFGGGFKFLPTHVPGVVYYLVAALPFVIVGLLKPGRRIP